MKIQLFPASPARADVPAVTRYLSFQSGRLASLGERGDIAACLPAWLVSLGWRGSPRLLAEHLPPGDEPVDLTDITNLMGNLGYEVAQHDYDPRYLHEDDIPFLLIPRKGPALVVVGLEGEQIVAYRPGMPAVERLPRQVDKGWMVICRLPMTTNADGTENTGATVGSWFRGLFTPFRRLIVLSVGLTLLSNLIGLATPLFVMVTYDLVIAANALERLWLLAGGAACAVLLEFLVRRLRTQAMTYGGIRLSYLVGNAIFGRLLNLPSPLTERASISAQVARIKDLERVRDLITGPVAQAALDLPFVLIFLIALMATGGRLVVVPLIAIALFVILGLAVSGPVNRRVSEAARAAAQRQELVLEMIEKMRALKVGGGDEVWLERYEDISARVSTTGFSSSMMTALIQTGSYLLTMMTGFLTVVSGISLVIDGTLTAGGLIAAVMLTWRVLTPVQGGFIAITRVRQLGTSVQQIDNLMRLAPERPENTIAPALTRMSGRITFTRVTFRYGREADPVLANVTFDIQPGDFVALIGQNGAGKSTLIKLITGLYQTQVGTVRIDDRDLRQYDPAELRHAIAYVPQRPHMFFGTVAENIRVAMPLATDEEIWEVLDATGAREQVLQLPERLDTLIDTRNLHTLPASLMARLSVARALVKKARINLFDDSLHGLDSLGETVIMNAITRLRENKATVIMITHRPSHIRMADKLLILQEGNPVFFGPVANVPANRIRDFI